jgi:hypothetical protein
MLAKLRIALVAVLVAGTASAALARTHHDRAPYGNGYGYGYASPSGPVMTDEGQGRFAPADGGAP